MRTKKRIIATLILVSFMSFCVYEAYQYTENYEPAMFHKSNRNELSEIVYESLFDPILGVKKVYVRHYDRPARTPGWRDEKVGEIIETPKWMQSLGLQSSIYRFWNYERKSQSKYWSFGPLKEHFADGSKIKNSSLSQVIVITILRLSIYIFIVGLSIYIWESKKQ